MGASGWTATTEMSATTVYWEKVEVPIKCSTSLPLHLKRLVPSGMTPLPWVARILPQRLVLPDLQNLHSLHSGVLDALVLDVKLESGSIGRILEADDGVAGLDVGDALTNRLDDAGALVSEDNGESALGILARERVGVCYCSAIVPIQGDSCRALLTRVANTGIVNLNADLVGLGGSDLDILNGQVLAGLPGDGGLAGDGLFMALVSDLSMRRATGMASSWRQRPMEG